LAQVSLLWSPEEVSGMASSTDQGSWFLRHGTRAIQKVASNKEGVGALSMFAAGFGIGGCIFGLVGVLSGLWMGGRSRNGL
jgi:hypothetical protein